MALSLGLWLTQVVVQRFETHKEFNMLATTPLYHFFVNERLSAS
jgi:hypothetical protein